MNKKFKFASAILTASLLVTPISELISNYNNVAKAYEFKKEYPLNNDIINTFKNMKFMAKNSKEITDYEEIEELKNIAYLNTKSQVDKYDYDNIKAIKLEVDKKIYKVIHIPILNENLLSNTAIILNEKNEIINTSKTIVTKNNKNKFKIIKYNNNKLLEEINTEVEYLNNTETKKAINSLKQELYSKQHYKSWATAGCIAGILGVNYGIATVIAATCGVSCPVIVPICVACVTGTFALGVADINGVIKCFEL